MNIKINKIKEKDFKPFRIEIDINCKEDAALIFIIFIHPKLKSSLKFDLYKKKYQEINKIASDEFPFEAKNKIIKYLLNNVFPEEGK
jgi:hypothetical protein